jgi:OOP family OmpA-OmpF porin
MKKLMIALAFAGLSTGAMAQETVETPRMKHSVATNSFWSNWFVSVGGNYNAFYSSQEHGVSNNPFSKDRGMFGFDVSLGKWFTPGIGLRGKFNGIWGKQVNSETSHPTIDMWQLQGDVLFNLSNMIYGYSETRVWNLIPYVGVGGVRNCSDNVNDFAYTAGLLNTWKLNKHFLLNLDVYASAARTRIDGAGKSGWDKLLGASVGVTYNIGKSTWEKTPDVAALMAMNKEQMDAMNASLKEQQDENARLRDMLAKAQQVKPVTKTVKEFAATSQSVFFRIGSSRIASRKDLVNVKEVAEYAKANGNKILVTGYADSKTGSAAYNQTLSQKRADAVVDELVKMGVSRDNIIVEAKGGVNDIAPFSYNRRVTVKLQ